MNLKWNPLPVYGLVVSVIRPHLHMEWTCAQHTIYFPSFLTFQFQLNSDITEHVYFFTMLENRAPFEHKEVSLTVTPTKNSNSLFSH